MKPSHFSLSALFIIFLCLLFQASVSQSSELSTTTTKDWCNYIWDAPSTTSSATSIPSHSQDSSFSKVKAAAQRFLAFLKGEPPLKIAFKCPDVQDAEDHTHETVKQKASRKLDCAAIELMIEKELDLKRSRSNLVNAYKEHSRRVCCDFVWIPFPFLDWISPAQEVLRKASQESSKPSATTSPAPVSRTHVQNIRWYMLGTLELLAFLVWIAIRVHIMTLLIVCPAIALFNYWEGGSFRPGVPIQFLIERIRLEEVYEVVVHAPYVYLLIKVAGTINAARAWISQRKASKPDNKDVAATPTEKYSSRRAREQFRKKDRVQGKDEDEEGADRKEKNNGDSDWLVANKDEQEQNVV